MEWMKSVAEVGMVHWEWEWLSACCMEPLRLGTRIGRNLTNEHMKTPAPFYSLLYFREPFPSKKRACLWKELRASVALLHHLF